MQATRQSCCRQQPGTARCGQERGLAGFFWAIKGNISMPGGTSCSVATLGTGQAQLRTRSRHLAAALPPDLRVIQRLVKQAEVGHLKRVTGCKPLVSS